MNSTLKNKTIDDNDFAMLANSLPDNIGRYDTECRIIFLNKRLEMALGLPLESVRGFKPSELAPDGRFDELENKVVNCAQTGIDDSLEITVPDFNGRTEHHHLRITPEKNYAGQIVGVIVIGRDMTDRLALEQKLISSSRLASMGEMAGGVAHEINSPLAIIQGKCHQLRQLSKKNEFSEENVLKCVSVIELTIKRIEKIVHGLRHFSRETNKDSFSTESLLTICNDSLAFCEEKIKSRGIVLEFNPDQSINYNIDCRSVEISQVIINLMNNAIDAVRNVRYPKIKIYFIELQNTIQFIVEDNGHGVPKEYREKIMQPFFTTKPLGEGTGLGLSISKGIAKAHRGDLYLATNATATQFVLELPKIQLNSVA